MTYKRKQTISTFLIWCLFILYRKFRLTGTKKCLTKTNDNRNAWPTLYIRFSVLWNQRWLQIVGLSYRIAIK